MFMRLSGLLGLLSLGLFGLMRLLAKCWPTPRNIENGSPFARHLVKVGIDSRIVIRGLEGPLSSAAISMLAVRVTLLDGAELRGEEVYPSRLTPPVIGLFHSADELARNGARSCSAIRPRQNKHQTSIGQSWPHADRLALPFTVRITSPPESSRWTSRPDSDAR